MATRKSVLTQHVDVNGTRMTYRIIGPPSEYPLLCLQHFTGSMDGWDPAVITGLSRNRQVILFDNRGVGESEGATPDTVAEMKTDTLAKDSAPGFDCRGKQ